jgi:hypothetical protein
MRVRYEVFCGGRLLKETEQVELGGITRAAAGAGEWADGHYRWMVDQQYVADDVAQAILAAGESAALTTPPV